MENIQKSDLDPTLKKFLVYEQCIMWKPEVLLFTEFF